MVPLLQLVVFAALLHINEAFAATEGVSMRVASTAEIMARMTTEIAAETVLRMNATAQKPELMALIESKLAGRQGEQSSASRLQLALRGSSPTPAPATGYSALDSATDMLNEMGEETRINLEAEETRCSTYDETTKAELETMRTLVAGFNADAAGARAKVISAQGIIATLEVNMRETTEAFDEHKRECVATKETLEYQLKIVRSDIVVMGRVLDLMDCGDAKVTMLQCQHCADSVMLQHPVQQLLNSLQSKDAKMYVKDTLADSFDEADDDDDTAALTQEQVEHMRVHGAVQMKEVHIHRDATTTTTTFARELNITEVPEAPQEVDCQPTTKCSIASSPNCQKLLDRFTVVQVGIVDKRDELEEALRKKDAYCTTQDTAFTESIEQMEKTLREERTKLAEGTEAQNIAESGSHTQSAQHDKVSQDYTNEMTTCCENQNTFKSELCALGKIRGELNNMNGTRVFITDCETTDWVEEECSRPCGGGLMVSTRQVVTHIVGRGMTCPPLSRTTACNPQRCPIDCVLGDWSEWSECGANCGGGVRERKRDVHVPSSYGGAPCEDTEELQSCNMDACSEPCKLSEWSEWGACSKACGGGTQRRTKTIAKEKVGDGQCWEADDDARLDFKDCATETCRDWLRDYNNNHPEGMKTVFKCSSVIDVVIVLDGSASLRPYGWKKSVEMAKILVGAFNDGSNSVNEALLLYSGPKNWNDYRKCKKGGDVDMENLCGLKWVSHFTNDTEALKKQVEALEWPQQSTFTAGALGLAEAELVNGREFASSVVIVITDGKPISERTTKIAAKRLQEKAKLIWVPIGKKAPRDMIKKLASKPASEHVIDVKAFSSLKTSAEMNGLINRVITTSCPSVT